MLHQLIFAAPKPGMSEADFQDYWVHKHAVQYASKIPQIRSYCVDTRIKLPDETTTPLFSGIAEIWLDDAAALLEALQSPELIKGARADEPNWAAFWQTVALNTETHVVLSGPAPGRDGPPIKVVALMKRKAGTSMAAFRERALQDHATTVQQVAGLRRYHQCHVPDLFSATAETPFDGVDILWFDDVPAGIAALEQIYTAEAARPALSALIELKYLHVMLTRENWIIDPSEY